MLVPEAAMHENNRGPAREHKIRFSRQVRCVKPVAQARRVQGSPEFQLRLGVTPPDAGHPLRALLRRKGVHHQVPPRSVLLFCQFVERESTQDLGLAPEGLEKAMVVGQALYTLCHFPKVGRKP